MKSSYLYITDRRGRKLTAGEIPTTAEALQQRLRSYLRGGLCVALEAGNQSAWLHDRLVELGAEVTVVNPTRVKLIAESRRKTDKIDAKILCELLRLNGLPEPVHIPGPETRSLRGLLVARRQLVAARTKLCNVVRGMLRQEGIRLATRELNTFIGWQRLLARSFSAAHLLPVSSAGTFRRACDATAEHAQGWADCLADVSGGSRPSGAIRDLPQAGELLGIVPHGPQQWGTDGIRFDQPRRTERTAGGVGADRAPGGGRPESFDGAAASLV
jgi:transposase